MKHPVLNNRVWLIVWWLVWLLIGLGQSLLFYFAYGSFASLSLIDSLLSLLIYSGIALSLWFPFNYFHTSRTSSLILSINLVATGFVTITLWVLITKHVILLILPAPNDYLSFWESTFPYRIGTGAFIYGLIIVTYFLFISLSNLSEKNARAARLEALVKETELKMLRSQINPHFLFNSLNSISSLTVTNPEKARIMVIKLSDFMRYALSRKDEQPVSLSSELENINLYLDIEKVRFGERLITEEDIEEDCLAEKIPVMLLQPLYENAVKHGVYESTGNVRLATTIAMENNYLQITIRNNYENEETNSKGTGTGLVNVSRRLELLYGDKASLKISRGNGIFTAELYIPVNIL